MKRSKQRSMQLEVHGKLTLNLVLIKAYRRATFGRPAFNAVVLEFEPTGGNDTITLKSWEFETPEEATKLYEYQKQFFEGRKEATTNGKKSNEGRIPRDG